MRVQELAAVFFYNSLNMYLVREGDETGSVVFYVASGQIKFMRCACVRACERARAHVCACAFCTALAHAPAHTGRISIPHTSPANPTISSHHGPSSAPLSPTA